MIDNGTSLERWSRGENITAAKLNAPVDELNRQRGVAPPQQRFDEPRGSGSSIACIIVSVHKDHLVCTRKGSGTPIMVARPLAARSPDTDTVRGVPWIYGNYSTDYQHRRATNGNSAAITEQQVILREYKVGGVIRAMRVDGGTDVPEAPIYEEVHSDRTWYRDETAP